MALVLLGLLILPGYRFEATNEARAGITVVASLFPQYDFARQILGERGRVILLLPPGTESHTFDPRPADIASIETADVFIYTGDFMEHWAGRLAAGFGESGPLVVDASAGVLLLADQAEPHDHAHDEDLDHDHGGFDPHFWLDPTKAIAMVRNVERGIVAADQENAEVYRQNADALVRSLEMLDADTASVVAGGSRHTLVFGGRFAYRYFLERYGLEWLSAYASCGAHDEPSVRDLARIIEYVNAEGIPCIYHEEFVDPRVARTIAEATGAELELFSTAHNVTKDELANGVTFVDIMRRNLAAVKKGLD